MGADAKRSGLEGVYCGEGILNASFLHIADPYGVDLGTGVFSSGICFIVYVAVIVFARPVVTQPACWCPAASFRCSFPFFRRFSFFSPARSFWFAAFAVIPLSPGAGEFLLIGSAGVWDAFCVRAIPV